MNVRLINLCLMIFWLLMGAGLLLRHLFLPEEDRANPRREQHLNWMGYLALVLALWNGFRWWMIRTQERRRLEQQAQDNYRRQVGSPERNESPQVTDPQFQFDRPEPPPNGERR